jgi:hypothetical protein
MNPASRRTWAVRIVFAAVALHLVVGMALPFIVHWPFLNLYHQAIAGAFWGPYTVPAAAIAHQRWWMALFGPTVQAAAIWMGALAWLGARHRLPFAWGALMAGLLLWAPQDMAISLQADAWMHVWLDALALAGMLPPLAYLFFIDRRKARDVDSLGR